MASGQDSNVRYVAVGLTDVGRVREHNEDNFLATDLAAAKRGASGEMLSGPVQQKGLALVVADGMGGAAAGEVASQMAVDMLHEQFRNADLGGSVRAEPDVIGLLETSINKANEAIFRKGQESKEHQGMGTTLTAAVVLADSMYLSQVGDSRGYLLRKGKLVQMTRDQSLIGQLIEEGTLTEEQAEKLGGKNIILQALGVEETLKIDSKRYEILRGDTLLLCSDGLSGMAPDELIEKILNQETDLGTAAKKLIEAANMGGGKDNITCILARFEGEGFREPLTPLTDADKAGGTFHAPPAPKSKAGRNAVIATVAILGVVGAAIFWPKPVHLAVSVKPGVEATVTVLPAKDGGPEGFPEMKGTARPGAPAAFDLPRGKKFDVRVEAPDYLPQTETVNTDVEYAEMPKDFTLVRVPGKSLDLVPPVHRRKPLEGVKVLLVPREMQKGPTVAVEVKAGGDPEYPTEFPAGKWKGTATRAGFRETEIPEFEVASRQPCVVSVGALEEVLGSLVVCDAPVDAVVTVLDGTEPLLPAPAKVLATRATQGLEVRATEVTVRVEKEGYAAFTTPATVVDGKETRVSMARHKGSLSLKGPPGAKIRLLCSELPTFTPKSDKFDAQGKAPKWDLDAATYKVVVIPLEGDEDERTVTLEPGQLILDRDVSALPK